MIINFSYKGKSVSIKSDRKFDLKRAYDYSIPKFEPLICQELELLGNDLNLRSQYTGAVVKFNDLVCKTVPDKDTIIIEPKQALFDNNSHAHSPKRHDPLHSINKSSPVSLRTSNCLEMKNNVDFKSKKISKFPHSIDAVNDVKEHRYQKSDQTNIVSKSPHHGISPFDRSDFRRSLGADVALQFDIPKYTANRTDNVSMTQDSESSVSDFSNLPKTLTNRRPSQLRNLQTKFNDFEKHKSISKSAPASPTKPMPPPRSPHTHMSMLNSYNVRTIGNKIHLSIMKKPVIGLGFTIVTRDNQVQYGSAADIANSVVILVNKILPNGGAAEDGRLQPGDRLLEVNSSTVSSLKDATEKLRAIPENECVRLLISRVDRLENPANDQQPPIHTPTLPKKQITFEIPLNQNQRDKRQFGINIRCLEDKDNPTLGAGIYVHSILANSLASQQGIRIDDKLIGINGHSLDHVTVEETIGQLKKAVQHDAVLVITVYRVTVKESLDRTNDISNKEHNHKVLPNTLAPDRITRDNPDYRSLTNCSHYSSNDSLSHQNNSIHQMELGSAFVRESKGRRSMSDKRKAHEDATQYNFYKETRMGNVNQSDDRLYSTLPTASRLKKMSNSQPQKLSNKIQGTVKPSQIKQLSTPKTPTTNIPTHIHNRSISLRSSPSRTNQSDRDHLQSARNYSQTPTNDQQPSFNRAMNNSFKRAVQKSHPGNGHAPAIVSNADKAQSLRKEVDNIPQQALIENTYPIYNSKSSTTDKFNRSHSVKDHSEKTKCFNLKSFLTFSSNSPRTKPVAQKEKSDTFPLNQHPQYHQSSSNNNSKQTLYSPVEVPKKTHHAEDPVIVDSTKRVLEWQMKNEDVVSKEIKVKEPKIYQTISSHGTSSTKNKADVTTRTPISSRNTFPKTQENPVREMDLYDSIGGVLSSPIPVSKQRASHPRSVRLNSHSQVTHTSPKNGHNSHSSRITYQTNNSRKISPTNDVYATVNKSAKKTNKSSKVSSGCASHSHTTKYRF